MDYLNINKKLWDEKTKHHYNSEFYDVGGFLKGKSSLNSIELDLLGDVNGKSILHLQCHFGLDTLSLARMGAQVTGVDLSEEAIKKARELAAKTRLEAEFIESDIYVLPQKMLRQFDLVFTSYGTVGWLPDMQRWAKVVSHFLKPGGRFVFVEFHPVVWMFSYDFQRIEFKYSDPEPIVEELEGTYADRNADIRDKSVSWNHGLANVVNALIKTGLRITGFQEYDYSPYDCFENAILTEEGKYQIKGLEGKIPIAYSVVTEKN